MDAAWLPTIYPPVAQLYFRAVTAVDESIAAFRVAAVICDAAIMVALAYGLRAAGHPAGWALAYAWHPLLPIEGASGAHMDLAGVLMLVLSWVALLRGRTAVAALTFVAALLVKPLPIVLAPYYWRRIRTGDAVLAAIAGLAVTAWAAPGGLPIGSSGTFIDAFRFNAPLFGWMETVAPPRALAAAAALLGLIAGSVTGTARAAARMLETIWRLRFRGRRLRVQSGERS